MYFCNELIHWILELNLMGFKNGNFKNKKLSS